MKFDTYFPTERLKPYIHYFVVSENEVENEYKVFPLPGLVIGFQYSGQLVTFQVLYPLQFCSVINLHTIKSTNNVYRSST